MTKVELHNHIKSVSEDYISKSWSTFLDLDETDLILAGIGIGKIIASEQEKRIADLEEQNKKLQEVNNVLYKSVERVGKRNNELVEENKTAKEIIKILYGDCKSFAECEDSKLGFWEVGLAKAEAFLKE